MTVLNADLMASTLRVLRDKAVDQTHKAIPLIQLIEEKGLIELCDGGTKVDHPVILGEHSNITELNGGYERIDMSVQDILGTSTFNWCDFIAPVVISGRELRSNKGKSALLKIGEARLKSVMGMLKREWCAQTIAGTSTKLSSLNTFNGEGTLATGLIPASSANTNGFFEIDAFGSQSNSIGGISKGDYTKIWQNQVADVNHAFGTNGETKMAELALETGLFAPEGEIDCILASKNSYRLFKRELEKRERYGSVEEVRNTAGKMGLLYNGAMVYVEPNLGFEVAGGTDFISMYFLNSNMFNVYFDKDANYRVKDWRELQGYDAEGCDILVRTQLAISHLASHGVLINAEQ